MSKYRSQQICRALEQTYGLTGLDPAYAGRGYTPVEQARVARQGRPDIERHTLANTVRACVAAAADEAEFIRRARADHLLLRARFAAGRTDVVTGYSMAERPRLEGGRCG
ncbi:hypothetical protein [Arthrobacter mobilis]|uniref:hypothetical protein n=1 Tax=Arthrobacter mobilis TaxID=2724944 RepID=UPI001FE91FCF|nr:hypothetical protein [Arthrobacter mobilis]